MRALVVMLVAVLAAPSEALPRNTVTNEDIRDAILQVVNVVRTTEDKLERHEYRERNLGEQLKKGLVAIDKRIKLLDPLKGSVSRLDERLAAVETILMQKDERERLHSQKTLDAVDDINKNLPQIVEKLKEEIAAKAAPVPTISKDDFKSFQETLEKKLKNVTDSIASMERELARIQQDNKKSLDLNNKSSDNVEKVGKHLSSGEQLLEKYETKLAEYNNKVPEVPEERDWHANFLQVLDQQKSNVELILSEMKTISGKVDTLPESLQNGSRPDGDLEEKIREQHNESLTILQEVSRGMDNLTERFSKSYEDIRAEIENLGKVEQVMVQTADSVLDTKRRVEYGVHQTIAETQKLMTELNTAINERFDTFELTILNEDGGALANLTDKIGQEIDKVWRQIGIMHQQMSASTDTLNKLQNQTDIYVNGSLSVMDTMKGKVGTITSRITEVDENLNYLVGKLSLVTHEFNQIKSGLGKALDEMKGTYKTIREQVGPGPHQIASDEVTV